MPPQNTACYLAAFFHLAFCVTSTIAVSPLLRKKMPVDKRGRRHFDVELQLRRTIFWSFAFELQLVSCSKDGHRLVSWQCIPSRHRSHLKRRHGGTQTHIFSNNFIIIRYTFTSHYASTTSFIIYYPSSSFIIMYLHIFSFWSTSFCFSFGPHCHLVTILPNLPKTRLRRPEKAVRGLTWCAVELAGLWRAGVGGCGRKRKNQLGSAYLCIALRTFFVARVHSSKLSMIPSFAYAQCNAVALNMFSSESKIKRKIQKTIFFDQFWCSTNQFWGNQPWPIAMGFSGFHLLDLPRWQIWMGAWLQPQLQTRRKEFVGIMD